MWSFRKPLCCSLLALLSVTAVQAAAPAYPSKPIKLIIPFSPGGATDVIGRTIAQELSKPLGQSIVVENKEGAGGVIGASSVARSSPDGYTLLLSSLSTFGLGSSQVPYDPIHDLEPVGLIAYVSNVLVAPPSFPANSVQELIAIAKNKPGQITYGTGGAGTSVDLSALLFNRLAGVETERIAYRGSSPALIDLMAGRIDIMFDNMPSAMPFVAQGKLKALAVTAGAKSSLYPNIPTMREAGVSNYELTAWYGISAPAGTPPGVIATINEAIQKAASSPELREQLASQSAELRTSDPADFRRFYDREYEKYKELMGLPPSK